MFNKAKDIYKKAPNFNKKRKITETTVTNCIDTMSMVSQTKLETGFNTMSMPSEPDITVYDVPTKTQSENLYLPRKKAIETVLEAMPNK